MNMAAPMLAVKNLSAGYGAVWVVQGFCLHVAAGELVGVAGLNGSGKSTALLGLAGLLAKARADSITLEGVSLESCGAAERARKGLGIVLQKHGIFSEATVAENVALALPGCGLTRDPFTLDPLRRMWVRLMGKRNAAAGCLSGGEQRMLGLGVMLLRTPKVLLADEPTLGVPVELGDVVFDELRSYAVRFQAAVVVVSHQWARLSGTCSRTVAMKNGTVVAEFAKEQLAVDGALLLRALNHNVQDGGAA